jgi:hypothetical protein
MVRASEVLDQVPESLPNYTLLKKRINPETNTTSPRRSRSVERASEQQQQWFRSRQTRRSKTADREAQPAMQAAQAA